MLLLFSRVRFYVFLLNKNYSDFYFSYADTVGAHHVSTSAKINKGIDELFFNITKRMIEKADEKASNSLCRNGVSRASSRRSVVVVEDDVPQKKSCCG